MKKIIVTGGTGMIGQQLVQTLADEGHELIVLSRSPDKHRNSFSGGVKLVAWDAKSLGDWAAEVDGADVVINLAAESIGGDNFLPDRWTDSKKKRIRQTRLETAHAVVEAVSKAKDRPELLLQASAIGYYGPRGDEWVTEQSSPGNDFLSSVAVEWEAASAAVEQYGVRRVLMRTGLTLTTEGGPLARMIVPFRFFVGGAYGDGSQWYSWIHLQDLVRAMRFIADSQDIAGPVNLVAPNPVTNKEFARTLGRVMNRPSLIPVPSFAMQILAGEASLLVLEGQRVSSATLQEHGFEFDYPHLEPALHDLLKDGSSG